MPQAALAVKELSRLYKSLGVAQCNRLYRSGVQILDKRFDACIHINRKTVQIHSLQSSDYTAARCTRMVLSELFRTFQKILQVWLDWEMTSQLNSLRAGHPFRVSAMRSKCRLTQDQSNMWHWSKLKVFLTGVSSKMLRTYPYHRAQTEASSQHCQEQIQ